MKRIVELAAASLPWAIRDRYREEWLHDLEHADEVDVRPRDIAWGAVRTAITADRMQAPSTAHALLQARVRVDSAGMHGSIATMLGLIAWQARMLDAAPIALAIVIVALLHSVAVLALLRFAAVTLGGRLRFAGPLWGLGVVLAAAAAVSGIAGDEQLWWTWLVSAACIITSAVLADSGKPPKPVLLERVRPGMRRPLLLLGWTIGALTVALCLIEALVIVPLRRVPGASLGEAWSSISAAGGPASPLLATALLLPIALAPIPVGMIGAMRWARTERGMLGWAAGGALFAAIGTVALCSIIAPISTILPLLAAALVHLTTPAQGDLTPLPPASVPLPPGPWHVQIDVAERGRVTG